MILIVVKFQVRPDRREDWLALMDEYIEAVRAEPGNRSFEMFSNDETPNQFVVIEEFESPQAGEAHVGTQHFKDFIAKAPAVIAETPKIVYFDLPGDGWSDMGELAK